MHFLIMQWIFIFVIYKKGYLWGIGGARYEKLVTQLAFSCVTIEIKNNPGTLTENFEKVGWSVDSSM